MDLTTKATILIVSASSDSRTLVKQLLDGLYDLREADSGAAALSMVQRAPRPDLVLLDPAVPDMDGYGILHELRSGFLTVEIPVLMLVAAGDAAGKARAWHEGAADFIATPIEAETLRARIACQVELKFLRASHKEQNNRLECLVTERTRAIAQVRDATIFSMASLAEPDDPNIGNHLRRTQLIFTALARELRFHGPFSAELNDATVALMAQAAPLHDIGKARVPEAILLNPGRLTPEQFDTMKLHTVYGRDAIASAEASLGASNPVLRYAREIAYSHQEKWDGSGYPQGLKGNAIPLSARLMAVADVYDALISKREYRPAFTHETAIELIRQGRGEHFDPDIVDAVLVIDEKLRAIAAQFSDLE